MLARILLVEDDPVSRDVLSSLLACRGHEVDVAEDGFGALRLAQDKTYDLVFVDYHLPEMDGYALARLMRTLAEKTGAKLNMVAITADRFGLATRRGVDSVFDSMLTKPIDPDTLYTFLDDFLAQSQQPASELDTFLAEPNGRDAQNAAQVLWRVRGISELPAAAVFPAPTPAERDGLEYCFRLVGPAESDCVLLTRASGLPDLEAFRATGARYLQPVFTLDEALAETADALFKVGDGISWSAAAAALLQFRRRGAMLKTATQASDIERRLAAYLFVAERPLTLRRDATGRTKIPYSAGFAPSDILAATKRLAASGLVVATPGAAQAEGTRELLIKLTPKGVEWVADAAGTAVPKAG